MEHGPDKKASSEKDASMTRTYESYSDTEKSKSKGKKEAKSAKKSTAPIAEREPTETQEKKPGLFEAPEKTEPGNDLSSLFDAKDKVEKSDTGDEGLDLTTLGAEPELPENPEEISDGELQVIVQKLLDAHESDLQADREKVEAGSPEEVPILAKEALVDNLQKIAQTSSPGESTINQAVEEVASELGIEPPEMDEAHDVVGEAENILKQTAAEGTDEEEAAEDEEAEPAETVETASVAPDESNDDEDEPVATMPSAPISASSQGPPTGGSGVPVPSAAGGAGAGGLNMHNFAAANGPLSPNVSYNASSPNTMPAPSATRMERRYRRGADLLVGGIIGYLIGRRRGRIKTEERLMPIQKSLEKKVKDVQEKLIISEEKVGRLASEKVAREGEEARREIADKARAKAKQKFEAREAARIEATQMTEAEKARATIEKQAVQIPWAKKSPETTTATPEKIQPAVPGLSVENRVEITAPQEMPKRTAKQIVESMPEIELLQAATNVEVSGRSAKELFEEGRLTREDLRAIVVENVSHTGRAERVLAERLRPQGHPEKLEALDDGAGAGSKKSQSGGSSPGAATPSIWQAQKNPASIDNGSPVLPAPSMNAAENRLAQDRTETKQGDAKAPIVIVTIVVVLAVLVLASLVF